MDMCKGLSDQIDDEGKGLKCLGELNVKEMEEIINRMLETARRWADDNES